MSKQRGKARQEPSTFDRIEAVAERLFGPRGPTLAEEVADKIFKKPDRDKAKETDTDDGDE